MGERNGFCSSNGNVEEPLSPQDGGASPHPEVPGATGRRTWVLVVAVLVALVLALTAAVAVLSGRTCGGDPAVLAPVLVCPNGWVGYYNVCYYLSRDEGSWEWSQEQCSSHGASLVLLRREWEMEFLSRLNVNVNSWIGLRRWGKRLEWVDGSSFNQTFEVHGQAECVYLYNGVVGSTDCSQRRPYICSKPQVPR
ncbi:C-type lectin domain family 2 member B-like [Numenius arquata]|uniref:C-type lectin domain family 2 member B-like n=1 Tax=Numenius arquata TaxID=31919 RepID=UPI003D30449C